MVDCQYCGEPLQYLPFKCKYCGKSFCKLHRLPENHECTGNYKQPVSHVAPAALRQSKPAEKSRRRMYADAEQELPYGKEAKKRRKKRAKRNKPRTTRRNLRRVLQGQVATKSAARVIPIVTVVVSLVSLIPGVGVYLGLSLAGLTELYLFYTPVSSIFLSLVSGGFFLFFGIMLLFVVAYFVYMAGNSIELRFGTRFFLTLFFLGGLCTAGLYIGLAAVFSLLPGGSLVPYVVVGNFYGAFYAMMTFSISFNPEGETRAIIMFLPIRMKMKYFLYILYFFSLGLGLIFFTLGLFVSGGYLVNAASSLSMGGGILAGKLLFNRVHDQVRQASPIAAFAY